MSQLIDNLNTIESIKTDIKSAIENKGVDMTGVSFGSYADKSGEISEGGGVNPSGTLEISENGVYDVYSYSSASVDVHPSISLSETYISNGNYNITGEFNGGVIKVDVPAPQFVTETLNVSANGTYTPGQGVDGYSQVVVDVPISGWDQKSITEGTNEIINLDNSASFVASSAFISNKKIQTVNLPNCISVGMSAFNYCLNLYSVSLPICETLGEGAFSMAFSLKYIYIPVCSSIGNGAFRNSKLQSIDLHKCVILRVSTFNGCSKLVNVSIPICETIGDMAFKDCTSLNQLSLPMCSFIRATAFQNCSSLSIITIGYSGVCSLYKSNAFINTQITSSTGSIYVPASLVDSYKSATNWSYFSTQIFPISE